MTFLRGDKEYFELTENHIKLLKRMYVGWQDCETGAPEINPKRPYGNSSVASDIAEILGMKENCCPHCDEPLGDSPDDDLMDLHRETELALQIVLQTGSFETGRFKYVGYRWERM